MFLAIYAVIFSLVAEAVPGLLLEQKDLSMTKEVGKSVYISCNVTGLSSEYLHWYQKKEDKALIRILYVKRNSKPAHDNNLPDAKDFDTRLQFYTSITARPGALKSAKIRVYYKQITMFLAIYAVLFSLVTEVVLGVTLEQKDLSMTKEEEKSLYISCNVKGLTTSYVHWYQKKEGEAFKRILYVKTGSPAVPDNSHPEAKDFDVRIQSDNYDLKIANLKKSHSAVYYCASWAGSHSE
ncbi:hypothetical protein HF521_019381 [Silurus meridionalis]|uniref:Ig-like domain-containing protein n=1 Tax=Silurus meridionalis TaxID=175797 RepID=A0A8T0BKG1_SILME|nr:hypothetical protein HF521_019381 [Silurus meridionalis]